MKSFKLASEIPCDAAAGSDRRKIFQIHIVGFNWSSYFEFKIFGIFPTDNRGRKIPELTSDKAHLSHEEQRGVLYVTFQSVAGPLSRCCFSYLSSSLWFNLPFWLRDIRLWVRWINLSKIQFQITSAIEISKSEDSWRSVECLASHYTLTPLTSPFEFSTRWANKPKLMFFYARSRRHNRRLGSLWLPLNVNSSVRSIFLYFQQAVAMADWKISIISAFEHGLEKEENYHWDLRLCSSYIFAYLA
jgi:hypothetical protein